MKLTPFNIFLLVGLLIAGVAADIVETAVDSMIQCTTQRTDKCSAEGPCVPSKA